MPSTQSSKTSARQYQLWRLGKEPRRSPDRAWRLARRRVLGALRSARQEPRAVARPNAQQLRAGPASPRRGLICREAGSSSRSGLPSGGRHATAPPERCEALSGPCLDPLGDITEVSGALCATRDGLAKHWSGRWDLNPRPSRWQRDALPLSYTRVRAGCICQFGNGGSYAARWDPLASTHALICRFWQFAA